MRSLCYALTLALGASSLAAACIHTPATWEGSLEQTGQSAIAFWDQGVQDLVIRPAIRVKGVKGAEGSRRVTPPQSFAWVVPVPTAPTSYGVVEAEAFSSLFEAWEANAPRRRGERSAPDSNMSDKSMGGIELLPSAVVGEYTIQPIKTVGADGAVALNAWLTSNGFGAVPSENMAYYVERDWVWLCVRADMKVAEGDLRALRATFKTPEVVYPLKFSTHQGTFALTLWVVTKGELPTLPATCQEHGLTSERRRFELPKATSAAATGTKLTGAVLVTKVSSAGLSGAQITKWKRDLAFTPAQSD